MRIAPGDLVRVKIVGTRVDAAEIVNLSKLSVLLLICLVVRHRNHQGGLPRFNRIISLKSDFDPNNCLNDFNILIFVF